MAKPNPFAKSAGKKGAKEIGASLKPGSKDDGAMGAPNQRTNFGKAKGKK